MGILLVSGILVSLLWYCDKKYDWEGVGYAISVLLGVIVIPLSVLIPGDYYMKGPQLVKIGVLSTATNTTGDSNSISFDKDGCVSFIRLVEDDKNGASWKPVTVQGTIVVEYDDYEEPTLEVYDYGYKMNFWTLSMGYNHHLYVFKLPKTEKRFIESIGDRVQGRGIYLALFS